MLECIYSEHNRDLDDPLIRDLVVKAQSPTPRGFLDQIKQADPDALDRESEVYFEHVVNMPNGDASVVRKTGSVILDRIEAHVGRLVR